MLYTLGIRICSLLYGSCMLPMSDGVTYPDFASCILKGNKTANEMIITLPTEEINKNQLYIQFACIEKPDIKL